MKKKLTIAIDGWSSCGKSTLASDLAKALDYIYVDSGAMYRCVTLFALRNNWVSKDEIQTDKIISSLPEINISFMHSGEGVYKVYLNNENVDDEIRSLHVSNAVSSIAKIKEVREHLVSIQRKLGENGGVVMDGRDIGSVVFPNAELKIFLTAEPKIRAQRRFNELKSKGQNPTLKEVEVNLKLRDQADATRETSPLVQTEDAIVLDNSYLSREEQLQKVLKWVEKLD